MHGITLYGLTILPSLATFVILLAVCFGGTLIVRERTEGIAYMPSWSSFIGIPAFLGAALLGADIIRSGAHIPVALTSTGWHLLSFFGSIVYGFAAYTFVSDGGRKVVLPADKYHHLVAAPIQAFLMLVLGPVTIWAGSRGNKWTMSVLLMIFVASVIFDNATGRSKPRKWMEDRGFGKALDDWVAFQRMLYERLPAD